MQTAPFHPPTRQHSSVTIAGYLSVIGGLAYLTISLIFILWQEYQRTRVWEIIPTKAISVLEIPDFPSQISALDSLPLFQQVQRMSAPQPWEAGFQKLDSLLHKFPDAARAFALNPAYISTHLTATDDFGHIFYLPAPDSPELRQALLEALSALEQRPLQQRAYKGHILYEWKEKGEISHFTATFFKNYLVGSRSSQLVEDALREAQTERVATELKSLRRKKQRLEAQTEGSPVWYFNMETCTRFTGMLQGDPSHPLLPHLRLLAAGAVGLGHMETGGFRLKGQYVNNTQSPNLLDYLEGQKTDTLQGYRILPQNTQLFAHFSFVDGAAFFEALEDFRRALPEATPSAQTAQIFEEAGFDMEDFWEKVSGEMIWASINATRETEEQFEIVLLRSEGLPALNEELRTLATQIDTAGQLESVAYGETQIHYLPVPGFMETLLGMGDAQSEGCYFAPVGQHLVIGNQRQAVAAFIDHRRRGKTLGELNAMQAYEANRSPQQANVKIGIHFPAAWQNIYSTATTGWKAFLSKHQRRLLRHEVLVMDWQADRKQGMEAFLNIRTVNIGRASESVLAQKEAPLASPVARLEPVVNHHTGGTETALQDRWHRFYLFNEKGEELWHIPLGRPITTPIQQIDFLGNGKLQYLFGAGNRIYLIDREGRYVRNFPIPLPAYVQSRYLAALPYNQGKNFRFLATDDLGNAFMISQYGTLQKGWQPRIFGDVPVAPPIHFTHRGQDLLLFLLQDGSLHTVGLNAKPYGEFPLLFNLGTTNPLFFEKGSRLADTHIAFLGNNGEMVQLNMEGKVLERSQMPRRYPGSGFRLCPDRVANRSWLIARHEGNETAIISEKGEIIFKKRFANQTKREVQFHQFGEHIGVISILDVEEEKVYLFFKNGDPVPGTPIACSVPVVLQYAEKANLFTLYAAHQKSLKTYTFHYL